MISLESSPIEDLEGQPEGSRFFIIHINDPQTGMTMCGCIGVAPENQEAVRRFCVEMGFDFETALPYAAAGAVIDRIWGDNRPEGIEIESIEESSKEEIRSRRVERASGGD